MDGHMDRQTDDQMDILMVGQNDWWEDEWMVRQMDGQKHPDRLWILIIPYIVLLKRGCNNFSF